MPAITGKGVAKGSGVKSNENTNSARVSASSTTAPHGGRKSKTGSAPQAPIQSPASKKRAPKKPQLRVDPAGDPGPRSSKPSRSRAARKQGLVGAAVQEAAVQAVAAGDAAKEDCRSLKSLQQKEQLDRFQDSKDVRQLEYYADDKSRLARAATLDNLSEVQLECATTDYLIAERRQAELVKFRRGIDAEVAEAETKAAGAILGKMRVDADLHNFPIAEDIQHMELKTQQVQARSRYEEVDILTNCPTNELAEEVWVNTEAALLPTEILEDRHSHVKASDYSVRTSKADVLYYLSSQGRTTFSSRVPQPWLSERVYDSEGRNNMIQLEVDDYYQPNVIRIDDLSRLIDLPRYGPCKFFELGLPALKIVTLSTLYSSLESIKICDIDPNSYDPSAEPTDQLYKDSVHELETRYGSVLNTGFTTFLWGPALAATSVRMALSTQSFLTGTFSNIWEKYLDLVSCELRAVPIRTAKVWGDNRPLLDRATKAAKTTYVEYHPYVICTYKDGTNKIYMDPSVFGLSDWATSVFSVQHDYVRAAFGPLADTNNFKHVFKPLVVNSSLLHELTQRKTIAPSSEMQRIERAYRLAEGSQHHQEVLKSLLYDGVSSYKDTIKLVNSLLTNKPNVDLDF